MGRTVMGGTKLEEFEAEVLGVMRDVSPGRDMVLCRLKGCNLEHAGIIQGMSGSPVYIDGKLLGAVAFAWEFAKDPIAGITPFQQMIQYVRSNDRRIAAESKDPAAGTVRASSLGRPLLVDGLADPRAADSPGASLSLPVSGGGLAGRFWWRSRRDDADRHAAGRVGFFRAAPSLPGRAAAAARAWRRWRAGPRRSGSSARKAIGRSCPGLRSRSRW